MSTNSKGRAKEHQNFQEVIDDCQKMSKDGNYIFRGTSCSRKLGCDIIQSSLYRRLADNNLKSTNLDLLEIERDKVMRARYLFPPNTSDIQILTELRHYGDDLAIIDFTRNLFVALFFACGNRQDIQDKQNNKDDGEIILLKIPEIKLDIDYKAKNLYAIEPATENASHNRMLAQDSIFVHARQGYININDSKTKIHTIKVECELKVELLEHLRKFHNIETKSIFRDIAGFISSEKYSTPFDYYRGMVAVKEGRYEDAFVYFDNFIKINPQSYSAFNSRGVTLSWQNKIDDSIVDYSMAIEINPDYDLAYFNRALALIEKCETNKALLDLDKSLEINPRNKEAYLRRGGIYLSRLKFKKALQDADHILAADPTFGDALRLRIKANLALNKSIDAQKDFENYISLHPNKIETYLLKGFYYTHQKNEKRGLEEYFKAISLDSKNIQANMQIGLINCTLDNYKEAINFFSIAIDNLNTSKENKTYSYSLALYYRGWAYFLIGNIEQTPKNAKDEVEYYKAGIADISKAMEINPDFTEGYKILEILYRKLGDPKMADKYLKKSTKQNNQSLENTGLDSMPEKKSTQKSITAYAPSAYDDECWGN